MFVPLARLLPLALVAGLVAAAPAAAAPVALPAVSRTLAAAGTSSTPCGAVSPRRARGVGLASYKTPRSGFVSFRLAGRRGDWDLAVFDKASGRRVGASQGFGAEEVVQRWAYPGQVFTLVACHAGGGGRSVPASISLVAAPLPKAAAATASLVRVRGNSSRIAALEDGGFDVTHERGPGFADVVVAGEAERARLRRTGLLTSTRIADLGAQQRSAARADSRYTTRAAASGSPIPSGRTTYRNYEDIQAELKGLTQRYKSSVRPVVLGRSFQRREIAGIEIASKVRSRSDGRPVYLLVALHHAREWPSAEAAMEYALMLARAKTGRLARLKKRVRTVIVPLVNPDGYVASRNASAYDPASGPNGSSNQDPFGTGLPPQTLESIAPPGGVATYRRKNCNGQSKDPDTPCELQYGVDPNRNYGEKWGGPGSSPDTTSQSFHGDGPWSETETEAIHRYSQRRQVTLVMTLHNVAALVLRPPGLHDQGLSPDEKAMKRFGDAMGRVAGYESQYSFQLYDTAGTTEDWNYAAQGAYGYTIEIGPPNGAFHEPYKIGLVDEWNGTGGHGAVRGKGLREALVIANEAAAKRRHHSVLRGRAPKGVTLRLTKKFRTFTSDYCFRGTDPAVSATEGPTCNPGQSRKAFGVIDGLNTTLVVGRRGRFVWDIAPSTRPFVGGGAVKTTVDTTPTRVESFSGRTGAASQGEFVDHPFTIASGDQITRIDLSWPTKPEDYDLAIYRCLGACDGKSRPAGDPADKQVGSSGNPPGLDEQVQLDTTTGLPGKYYARVSYFLATTGSYTGRISRFRGRTRVSKGRPEAWHLFCERKGKRISRRKIVIKRGQTKSLKISCRKPRKRR